MDTKLKILKNYLDLKLAQYELFIERSLEQQQLVCDMFCNSTPGVVNLYISYRMPDAHIATSNDFWYDGRVFYQLNEAATWLQFDEYNHEFFSTLIDVTPPLLHISGPLTIVENSSAEYQATIFYGTEIYRKLTPTWSISNQYAVITDKGKLTARELSHSQQVTVTAEVMFRKKLVRGTLDILITDVKPSLVSLSLGECRTELFEQETTHLVLFAHMTDGLVKEVTDSATTTWRCLDLTHTIYNNGTFIAGKTNSDVTITVQAQYVEDNVVRTLDVQLTVKTIPIVWTPVTLTIVGPSSVDERTVTQYKANLLSRSNKNATKTDNDVIVAWSVNTLCSISALGQLTANKVSQDTTVSLTASLLSSTDTVVSSTKDVLIKNVPLLLNLSLALQQTSIYGGYSTKLIATLTRNTGQFDVTSDAGINYTSTDPELTVNKVAGDVNVNPTTVAKTITISASYVDDDEQVTASTNLAVMANTAKTLFITPFSTAIFEGETTTISTTMLLIDNQTIPIAAAVSFNPAYGVLTNDQFTANSVAVDTTVNLLATYTGIETGNLEKTASASLLVKKILPIRLDLDVDTTAGAATSFDITRYDTLVLRTRLTFNNQTEQLSVPVSCSLSPADQVYAGVTTALGRVTVVPKNILADRTITVVASYTAFDGSILQASQVVSISYIQELAALEAKIANDTYYEGLSFNLTVREKYDNGTFGPYLTTGTTWEVTPLIGTVTNNVLTLGPLTSDTPFTVQAVRGTARSNTLSLIGVAIVPTAVALTTTKTSIKRDEILNFSAELTLNNGVKTVPTAEYPVVYTITGTNSQRATLTTNADNTATLSAGPMDVDTVLTVSCTSLGIVGTKEITVDGYPIPLSAVISGETSVNSNAVVDYTLTVTMSDGSQRVINAAQTQYSGNWAVTPSSVGVITTNYGQLTASADSTATSGTITASYTDSTSGITVAATDFTFTYVLITLDPYWTDVIALLHCDGQNGAKTTEYSLNIINEKTGSYSPLGKVMPTSVEYTTSSKKFGLSSLNFNLGCFYLSLDMNKDYTVEGFVNFPLTNGSETGPIISIGNLNLYGYRNSWIIVYNNSELLNIPKTILVNTWYYWVIERFGITTYLYVEGELIKTFSSVTDYGATYIGGKAGLYGAYSISNVQMDEIRITKAARYKGVPPAVPSEPFPS